MDCYEDCVAVLCGLPLDFLRYKDGEIRADNSVDQVARVNKLLRPHWRFMLSFGVRGEDLKEFQSRLDPRIAYVVSGMSPRGVQHSVLYMGVKPFADPHSSGAFLLPDQERYDVDFLCVYTTTEV